MNIETITGNLLAYKRLKQGTFQHVDELMNARSLNRLRNAQGFRPELEQEEFYTADGMVYLLSDNLPMLVITRELHNPVLKNLDDAFNQLWNKKYYSVSEEDAQSAIHAEDSHSFDLNSLRLEKNDDRLRFSKYLVLKIGTHPKKYKKLNREERRLAERVYGSGNDFVENMKMLNEAKIKVTKICVLNPEYIKQHASERAIGYGSKLSSFKYSSSCCAYVWWVHGNNLGLRGVHASRVNSKAPDGCDTQKAQIIIPSSEETRKYSKRFVSETALMNGI